MKKLCDYENEADTIHCAIQQSLLFWGLILRLMRFTSAESIQPRKLLTWNGVQFS